MYREEKKAYTPFRILNFLNGNRAKENEAYSQLKSLHKSQAIIEFDIHGNIIDANDNFLNLMGYSLEDIVGKHHSMFIEEDYKISHEYQLFWEKLRNGHFISDEFKRLNRYGKDIWIRAVYTPILDENDKPYKIIKIANDVTKEKLKSLDDEGKIAAINRSQAVAEFDMSGQILTANDNFLSMMHYRIEEIQGKHHSIFVIDEFKKSEEYKVFWHRLNQGEFISSEFKRIDKNEEIVWIQASYNPVFDISGNLIKVVKYASDITAQKKRDIEYKKQIEESEHTIQRILHDLQERITTYRKHISLVAKGDLTNTLQISGKDDLSDLGDYINGMTGGLKNIAHKIRDITSEIAVGISQLKSTANSQAAASSEQAASISEISAIVEEIKATSQQTLDKAFKLGEMTDKTTEEGEKGINAITEMMTSMQDLQDKIQQIAQTILSLSDKTQQIGEITQAVSDIAKQSKMLALNASIEAAKAGETGKGFAVVAGEVKELADKSQSSTDRVQKILQDIRQTAEQAVMVTENGTKSVDKNLKQAKSCSSAMNVLGEVITESSIACRQIVSAVKEESTGIDQVVQSMREIDKATSHFNRSTEETKDSITSLLKVSEQLKESVSIYQLGDSSD